MATTYQDKQWLLQTEQRRALHKVPRRPFPAEQFKDWKPPRPITLKPIKPSKKLKFPGFWLWLGNSRMIWFVCDVFPAIGEAWKKAGQHARSTFSLDDAWLR